MRSTPAPRRRLGTSSRPGWSARTRSSSNNCAGGGSRGSAISLMPWRSSRCSSPTTPPPPPHPPPAPPAPPAPPTGRLAVHLEPAGAHPQRDGHVLQQAEQRAELRLLLIFRGRVTEQAHTACEPRGERLEGRHRGGSI